MSEKDNIISRKDFLRTAGSSLLFSALGIAFTACGGVTDANGDSSDNPSNNPGNAEDGITVDGDTITIDLGAEGTQKLQNQGEWLLINNASTLVVNVDGMMIRAFSSVCTHQGCSTNWQFSGSRFTCTCHGSQFDTEGQVVQGPATGNLEEFAVERNGDTVTITQ